MNHNPNAREKLVIFLNECEMFGVRRALRHSLSYLLSQTRSDFDRKYGVSTSGSVEPSEAEISDPVSLDNAINYEPTDEAVMRHILRYVATHFDPAQLTFVDLGCGRGRALLMAADLPFLEVIGVEISASHCRIAQQNVTAYRAARGSNGKRAHANGRSARKSTIVVCHENATEFEFPNTDLLVYLFNPFRGPVLRSVLERLAAFQAATRRRVHLILCSPRTEDLLLAHPAFRKQYEFQVIATAYSWSLWSCQVAAPRSAQAVLDSHHAGANARA
jgi:SAM-dependent methyltransferase